MRRRPALLLLVLVSLATLPASAGAQGLQYAPGTTRYRITTSTSGTQVTPLGNQRFELGVEQQLTVHLARRAADTLVATLTIDSISLSSQDPVPDVSRYRGSVFTTLLSPAGRVYVSSGPPGADALLGQLSEAIARFLPTYRGALRTGASWADTTTGRVMQQGVEVDRMIVAEYQVVGDTTIAGERALSVDRRTTMRAAGRGTANGSAVALETSSRSDGRFFLSPDGVYLGGRSSDDIDLRLTLVEQRADIVVRQKAVQQVQPIP